MKTIPKKSSIVAFLGLSIFARSLTLLDFDPATSTDTETDFYGTTRGMVANVSGDTWHSSEIHADLAADYSGGENGFVDFHRYNHQDYNSIHGPVAWTSVSVGDVMKFRAIFSFSCNGEYNRNKFAFGLWDPTKVTTRDCNSQLNNLTMECHIYAGVRLFADSGNKQASLGIIGNDSVTEVTLDWGAYGDNDWIEIEWSLSNGVVCDVKINGEAINGSVENVTVPSGAVLALGGVRCPHVKRLVVESFSDASIIAGTPSWIRTVAASLTASITAASAGDELWVEYWTNDSDHVSQKVADVSEPGRFDVILNNLLPATTYSYQFTLKKGASLETTPTETFKTDSVVLSSAMREVSDSFGAHRFSVDINDMGADGYAMLKLVLSASNGTTQEIDLGRITEGGHFATDWITVGSLAYTWHFELDIDGDTLTTEPTTFPGLAEVNSTGLRHIVSFSVTDDGVENTDIYDTQRGLQINLPGGSWIKPHNNGSAKYTVSKEYLILENNAWGYSLALPLIAGVYEKGLPDRMRVNFSFSMDGEFYGKTSSMFAIFAADKTSSVWDDCKEANEKLAAVPDLALRILTYEPDSMTVVEVIAGGKVCTTTDVSSLFPGGKLPRNSVSIVSASLDIDFTLGVICGVRIQDTYIPLAVGYGITLSPDARMGFSSHRPNNRIQLRTFDVWATTPPEATVIFVR